MVLDSVCISIKRHLELLKIEEKSLEPRKYCTDIRTQTYGKYRYVDRLLIETDDEAIRLLADELEETSKGATELELKLSNLQEDALNWHQDLLNSRIEIDRLNKRGFWNRVFGN